VDVARLKTRQFVPDPEDFAARVSAGHQADHKASSRGGIAELSRENFMKRRARESSSERPIERWHSEGDFCGLR
jgi:hypothetical protein